MTSTSKSSAQRTVAAAKKFNRRTVLKSTAAIAGAAAMGPFVIRDAYAAGTVNAIVWTNYLTDDFIKGFEKRTGINVNVTPLGSNEELLNKMKASKGRGFDLITPTLNRKGQWIDLGLLQPWDTGKVTNLSNVEPAFVKASEAWTWAGGQYHLPHIWGTEAMSWRTDKWSTEYGKLSFGDLWIPEMKGKVQGRPHSMMAGIGRYLEGIGKLPPFVEAYKDEDSMRKIWEEITKFAVEHKPWVKQFWNDHDTQKTGFMQNGVILGQTWDGPAIELFKDDKPVQYMAPKEGAFAWLDGLCMPKTSTKPMSWSTPSIPSKRRRIQRSRPATTAPSKAMPTSWMISQRRPSIWPIRAMRCRSYGGGRTSRHGTRRSAPNTATSSSPPKGHMARTRCTEASGAGSLPH